MMREQTESNATWLLPMMMRPRSNGEGVSMRPAPAVMPSIAMILEVGEETVRFAI